jgi:hypothetical protein
MCVEGDLFLLGDAILARNFIRRRCSAGIPENHEGCMSILPGLFVRAFAGFFYFIPSIVAKGRHHRQSLAVFILNLFLGWTCLGWVIALVWACTAVTRPLPKVAS